MNVREKGRWRRETDAERLRRVAMTLETVGRDTPGPEPRDDVETCAPFFGGFASWGLGA